MPTLTEDKKESIWKTYQANKSFSETGRSEGVDARTVKKVVQEKKTQLAGIDRHDSPGVKVATTSHNQNINPERKMQLKAYRLFEMGRTNFQVSQELKLSSVEVVGYRKEYNDMIKGDYDVELEQRKQYNIRIERNIQQLEGELSRSSSELKRTQKALMDDQDKLAQVQSQITDLSKERDEVQQDVETSHESVGIYSNKERELRMQCELLEQSALEIKAGVEPFLKNMEAIPVHLLIEVMVPFFNSKLFERTIPEPMTTAVLGALQSHPNKLNIFRILSEPVVEVLNVKELPSIDREDFRTLVTEAARNSLLIAANFLARCSIGHVPINIQVQNGSIKRRSG